MSYGLIFWGNSTHSKCIFKLQKIAIRIIMEARNNVSCREFFKLLKILPLSAQYIYSLLMFVVSKRNLFLDNAELYSVKKRNSYNLHPVLSHLSKYQNGLHYAGIRVISHLPTSIKSTANETKNNLMAWCIDILLCKFFITIVFCFVFMTFVIQQIYCVLL
jgi:hypothetical protein